MSEKKDINKAPSEIESMIEKRDNDFYEFLIHGKKPDGYIDTTGFFTEKDEKDEKDYAIEMRKNKADVKVKKDVEG